MEAGRRRVLTYSQEKAFMHNAEPAKHNCLTGAIWPEYIFQNDPGN